MSGLLGRVLIAVVRGYQLVVSPLLGPTCKFYPSCSAYSVQAIRAHGPWRGGWFTLARLGRCHPWSHGGVDHVPPPHSPDHPVSPAHLRD